MSDIIAPSLLFSIICNFSATVNRRVIVDLIGFGTISLTTPLAIIIDLYGSIASLGWRGLLQIERDFAVLGVWLRSAVSVP